MKPKFCSYKWEMLALFWFAYFLNQADRQIFNVVLPLIKADLKVDDIHLGLVATIFTLVYGLLVPVVGVLGDFFSRKVIVCLSLLVFSVGTLCTGFVGGLLGLVVMRSITTGGGEACYYPAANSLIGQYHQETRAQAMGIHQTALYIGIVVSSWLAGKMGELYGWRSAFYCFGAIGVLLSGVMIWRLRGDQPGDNSNRMEEGAGLREGLGVILRKPSFYLLSLAFGGMVFVHFGYMTWMPTYLYERFHLSLSDAALHATLWHYGAAFLGVLVGGRVSDRLSVRRPTIRFEVEMIGLLLGAPFIYLQGTAGNLITLYVAMAGFGFFRGLYDSNLFAALFDVISVRYRSSATGLMLFAAFTIGSASPVVLGVVKQRVGLATGLASLAVVYVFSAAMVYLALRRYFAADHHPEPIVATTS